jgi:hypothetical protein
MLKDASVQPLGRARIIFKVFANKPHAVGKRLALI